MSSPDLTTRLSTTGKLLVRSGMEIGRLLDAMLEDGDTLTASLPAQLLFLSKLLHVEPVKGYLRFAYSQSKSANSAVLATPTLTLRCNHRGALYAFAVEKPRHAANGSEPCLQCALPNAVLGVQQRRAQVRVHVPVQAPVGCDLRMGLQTFASRVEDVSLQGLGTLISDPTIPICAGTILQRARIRHPQVEPFHVDLEVRHVTRVVLPNGERATRIGCRVLGTRDTLEALIRLFVIDLA